MIVYHDDVIQGTLRQLFHYNQRSGELIWVNPPKNHTRMLGKSAGSLRHSRNGKCYLWVKINGRAYSLSRLAFLWMTGRWPADQIDHKNGDSLDNRWVNLREATRLQNSWNHKGRAKSTALPMGVRERPNGGFEARIRKEGTTHYLGTFPTVSSARLAYQRKRKEFFGEFA